MTIKGEHCSKYQQPVLLCHVYWHESHPVAGAALCFRMALLNVHRSAFGHQMSPGPALLLVVSAATWAVLGLTPSRKGPEEVKCKAFV